MLGIESVVVNGETYAYVATSLPEGGNPVKSMTWLIFFDHAMAF
jgi:hypothetical protein